MGNSYQKGLNSPGPAAVHLNCALFFAEDDLGVKRPVVTARQTVIEVKVPREAVGAVIGPQGSVIKGVSSDVIGSQRGSSDVIGPGE